MTEPIRVVHFADTHVGMENYGRISAQTGLNTRVEDFIRRINEIIDFASSQEADLIIFAGDAFKTRNPTPTYQREFSHCVRDLAAIAPVVLLVGNHDLPPMAFKASSIEIYDTLAVPNVWVADDYDLRVIETRRGPVAVGTAPYPIRSRLLEDTRTAGLTIAETDLEMQNTLGNILEELAEKADQHAMPRLLTAHFTVSGAVFGSERGIMLGRDIAAPLSSVADSRWDYVALGHVHKHQNLTAGRTDVPPVVYSGSVERIDFGEEGDAKGFCYVELERGAARWEFRPLPARPFVTLRDDLRQSDNPTQETVQLIQRHHLRDAVVRLSVQLTPETEALFNETMIRDVLRQAGVHTVAAIRKEIDHTVRARLGGSPEGLTDPELLDRYLISKQADPERRRQLLDAAEGIFEAAVRRDSL